MTLADLLARAEVFALRPGDALVIHLPSNPPVFAEEAAMLTERVEAHLPGRKVVIIQADKVVVESPSTSNEEIK